jgi:hypothetical protein
MRCFCIAYRLLLYRTYGELDTDESVYSGLCSGLGLVGLWKKAALVG